MIGEQFLARFGEAVAQLRVVPGIEPHDHRLIVPLGVFVPFVAKATEQGIGALAGPAAEVELGLSLGDPQHAHQADLFVFVQGPAEEFEFPVGPAGHVQHMVRSAAAIHGKAAAVVGQGGFRTGIRIVELPEFVSG